MSLLRLGLNPDGTRHILLEDPASPIRKGHGGAALGFFSGTVLTKPPGAKTTPLVERKPKERETCGIRLSSNQNARHNGEPCARKPGHTEPTHRSKAAMEHAAAMRRPGLR